MSELDTAEEQRIGQVNLDGEVVRVVKFTVPGIGEVDYNLRENASWPDTGDRMTWRCTSVVRFAGNGEDFDKKGFGKKPRHPTVSFVNLSRSFEVVSFAPREGF